MCMLLYLMESMIYKHASHKSTLCTYNLEGQVVSFYKENEVTLYTSMNPNFSKAFNSSTVMNFNITEILA